MCVCVSLLVFFFFLGGVGCGFVYLKAAKALGHSG